MTNLAPMYLAAYIKKMKIPVEVIIKDRLEDLESLRPEILGISSVTENYEHARRLALRAKQGWDPITILGGVHITALPQTLPEEFDLGVLGEGEQTLCDILHVALESKGMPDWGKLRRIPGLAFHGPSGIEQTAKRPDILKLDDIPPPDRESFVKKIGTAYIMTSRGCPYTCSFCVIPGVTEGYRKHSSDYVFTEIKRIIEKFPLVRHIRIFDDLYIVDRKRVKEIAQRVAAEGLNQELSFGCWGRANLIDEDMVESLQQMNMLYVAFGAESGSTQVLSQVKPSSSVEENQRAIDLLYDHGIHPSCSMIMGHPKETEEDLWASYHFIERNMDKLLEIEFNVAIPWPGTGLWSDALSRGIVSEDMNFDILKECG
ncbi:MAG: B12-binding domain-containing radical SAM protein, partial [Deltaproteobacteria bacterium]|nr:B12-binding domain-containing radical SAM protein [Deltaproteobacteria bacterium]